MKTKLEEAFDNYVNNFDMKDKQINFKYRHSYKVKELMKELAIKFGLTLKEVEVAEVIGLLHDIGRFEQIRKKGSCSDYKTGIDHADEGCVYLFDNNHIKDFYDDEDYYDIIKTAVKYHNKFKIDDSIKDKSLLFCKMIRDMDKVDIFRVVGEEFNWTYNKDDISDGILDEYNCKDLIDYKIMKTETDDVYGNISYLFDINFKESFEILKGSNNIELFFNIVSPTNDSIDLFNKLKSDTLLYIDSKIETNK